MAGRVAWIVDSVGLLETFHFEDLQKAESIFEEYVVRLGGTHLIADLALLDVLVQLISEFIVRVVKTEIH